MPITEKGTVEYNMPASIKESFTMEFLIDFKKKVVEIFKENDKRQGRNPNDYDKETYSSWWCYIEGTSGFCDGFRYACNQHSLQNVIDYYNQLPWYDSDLFDYELCYLLVERGFIELGEEIDFDEEETDLESE